MNTFLHVSRRHQNRSPQAGFSLLELLIYMAILGAVSVGIAEIFLITNRGHGQVQARSTVNAAIRFAMETISRDLRSASAVAVPATAGANASSLDMTIAGSTVSYCVTDGVLRRQSGGSCSAASEAITPDTVIISSPSFTRYENTNTTLAQTVVTIELILTGTYNSSSPDFQYAETKQTVTSLR